MKFEIGQTVVAKNRGQGTVIKLDDSNKQFAVLVRFGKRNLAWLPEKSLKPAVAAE